MTRVLIGIPAENLVSDLSSLLSEMDGFDVRAVARSTAELLDLTTRLEPDLVFVHDGLGIEPIAQTIRDLSSRRPAMAILQVAAVRTDQAVIKAMESGARGLVAYPFAYEDVSSRVMAATEWAIHMRGVLDGAGRGAAGRGRVIAVVGAKGGVGTTTLATHLAADHVDRHPDERVCLVDVDVEKGDIGAILEVRQAVSIADVAKVAGDLSSTAVNDAIVEHESGIHLLLAPLDVRHAEYVSAEALRSIVAMLRREFAVVIIDGGGHVSPAQAAVIEIADEALVVTTPDVLAMRGLRRRMIAWEALGVREEASFKVLVNKIDKASLFPAASIPKLTTAHVVQTQIPFSPRVVEAAMNQRDPRAITEVAWWRLMEAIRGELGLMGTGTPAASRRASGPSQPQAADPRPGDSPTRRRRTLFGRGAAEQPPAAQQPWSAPEALEEQGDLRSDAAEGPGSPEGPDSRELLSGTTRSARRERGGVGIENAGVLPLALLVCLVAWQVAVIGFTFIYSGHATTQAAREYAVTGSVSEAQAAALEAVPSVLRSGVQVQASGSQVSVTLRVPKAAPSGTGLPQQLTTTRTVVTER